MSLCLCQKLEGRGWPPYLAHQTFHHGATWKDSGEGSILSLDEPEKRKEKRAAPEALPTSKAAPRTGQEGMNPNSQGTTSFASSTIYQVCELGKVFNPLVSQFPYVL